MHAPADSDRTEAMPPVADDVPFPIFAPAAPCFLVPQNVPGAATWFRVLVRASLVLWTVTLPLWALGLYEFGRALVSWW